MNWLYQMGDVIGPGGCLLLLIIYMVGAGIFLMNCEC